MSNATTSTAPSNASGDGDGTVGVFNGSDGFTFNDEVAEEGRVGELGSAELEKGSLSGVKRLCSYHSSDVS